MAGQISPALSKIERRIKDAQNIEKNIGVLKLSIVSYENKIEVSNFELDELKKDLHFTNERILALCEAARNEGFSEDYIQRFLADHNYKLN